jgi:hypothetical protein
MEMSRREIEEWKLAALRLAVSTRPRTSWIPSVPYDYAGQLYSLPTIREHCRDMVDQAKAAILSAPGQWARTGRWPRFRNAGPFFLSRALQWALYEFEEAAPPDTTEVLIDGPPWTEAAAVWLTKVTVEAWLKDGRQAWEEGAALHYFEEQQDMEEGWRTYD